MPFFEIDCNYEAPQTWWENGGTSLFNKHAGGPAHDSFVCEQDELDRFIEAARLIDGWEEEGDIDCPVDIMELTDEEADSKIKLDF